MAIPQQGKRRTVEREKKKKVLVYFNAAVLMYKSCHYTLQHGVYGVQQVARPKL